jgi:rSAM/selenodomain-associated transferase 2
MTAPGPLSIVIPTLNEAAHLPQLLQDLAPLRAAGHEIIVVDGGSGDDTVALAKELADRVLATEPGRARQMNLGAATARHPVLWFLHADTRVPGDAAEALLAQLAGHQWGRFDVRLSGQQPLLRVVERLMNWRSCWSRIATGDQGIFVSAALFRQVQGYPAIVLMEDVALSSRLRRLARPACVQRPRLITSSRRWETRGIVRTIILMWRLRLAYALGSDPGLLKARYDA